MQRPLPLVDPAISRAETLPGWVYHDPEAYEHQRESVLARAWHLVADLNQVRTPGRVLPVTLLPGCLNEPLVVTRDKEGEVHCLSNVCTHRGALVVEGEGHLNALRCRYHGRKFGLDGSFQSMPEFGEVENFPRPCDNLPKVATGQWGPLLFASLDPFCPFEDWIRPVAERCNWLQPALVDARLDQDGSQDYLIKAHWALYCDNYLEEFHIPYIHSGSLAGLDYDAYRTERFEWGNLQFGYGKEGEEAFDLPPQHPDHGERISAYYFWLFPNLMLNFYPGALSVNVVAPLGPDRTRVSFLPWVWDPTKRGGGVDGDLHRVEMEDEEVVESQHRGLASRLYKRGRFSPRREVGTHHFHELLARFMSS